MNSSIESAGTYVNGRSLTVEKSPQTKANDKKFRLVWYYYQWPLGGEHEVIAEGLSRQEAEKLKREKDPHLKNETLIIEEEEEKIKKTKHLS